jgi:hypothetical protein
MLYYTVTASSLGATGKWLPPATKLTSCGEKETLVENAKNGGRHMLIQSLKRENMMEWRNQAAVVTGGARA